MGFGADGTRQTLKAGQRSNLVVTAEELLLGQPCCRSYTQSGAVAGTSPSLGDPKLLCARSDVHVKAWAVGDGQRTRTVRCDGVGSYPSADVDNSKAPDVHRAEGDGERTISVELDALHNGFRYRVPTEVLVPVEGPQIRAP